MDVVGYALIKKDQKSGIARNISKFLGNRVRVMEFARDGGVLVINSDGDELAMFDKEDILSSFKCDSQGDILCPPDLDFMEKTLYAAKCMSRKGGYNNIVREMVISASLHRREFSDGFLWQLQ